MKTEDAMPALALRWARTRAMRGGLGVAFLGITSIAVLAALSISCRRVTSPLVLVWQREHTAVDDMWALHALAFSPDGQLLAVGNWPRDFAGGEPPPGTIQLRCVQDGAVVRMWKTELVCWGGIAFSPDGALLYTAGGWMGTDILEAAFCIQVWRVADGSLVEVRPQPTGSALTALFRTPTVATLAAYALRAVSPDGRIEARPADWPGGVELRRVPEGLVIARHDFEPIGILIPRGMVAPTGVLGHLVDPLECRVHILSFSSDGKSLAVSDSRRRLTLFRVEAR